MYLLRGLNGLEDRGNTYRPAEANKPGADNREFLHDSGIYCFYDTKRETIKGNSTNGTTVIDDVVKSMGC